MLGAVPPVPPVVPSLVAVAPPVPVVLDPELVTASAPVVVPEVAVVVPTDPTVVPVTAAAAVAAVTVTVGPALPPVVVVGAVVVAVFVSVGCPVLPTGSSDGAVASLQAAARSGTRAKARLLLSISEWFLVEFALGCAPRSRRTIIQLPTDPIPSHCIE